MSNWALNWKSINWKQLLVMGWYSYKKRRKVYEISYKKCTHMDHIPFPKTNQTNIHEIYDQ